MFVILLIVSSIKFGLAIDSVFVCEIFYSGKACKVTGIIRSRADPTITLSAANPESVSEVLIRNSQIPVLQATNICNNFPNLIDFTALGSNIEEVSENAFLNCTKIKKIYLVDHNIKKIEKNTFRHLKNLYYLDIGKNSLSEFDMGLLNGLGNLEGLSLFFNKILDIDENKLIENCPKLKTLSIFSNRFLCGRNEEIQAALTKKNPAIYVDIRTNICLSKPQWIEAFSNADKDVQLKIVIKNSDPAQTAAVGYMVQSFSDEKEKFQRTMEALNSKINSQAEEIQKFLTEKVENVESTITNSIKQIVESQNQINNQFKNEIFKMNETMLNANHEVIPTIENLTQIFV